MKEKIKANQTKIIGWYNKSSDYFLCFKCFTEMNESGKEKYKPVKEKSLENDIYTCDKCGKVFNNKITDSGIEKEISEKIYENIKGENISNFMLDKIILKEIEKYMSFSEDWQKHYAKERIKNSIEERNSDFLPTTRTKRFLNFILDYAGLYIFAFTFGVFIEITGLYFLLDINEWVFNILFFIFYYGIFESIWSKTPAKFITKTKVIMENGEKPDFRTTFIRTLIRLIPFEACSFLSPKRPRGWHDKWSKTIVVDDISIPKKEIGLQKSESIETKSQEMSPKQKISYCGQCGNKINKHDKFCPKCGTKI